ncbi:MAG: TonB-dependent receptor [Candidatus Glassbacteria bacterium]|nr:TonB-dependent receptor [Candidatus Glassbacteria bacterium]
MSKSSKFSGLPSALLSLVAVTLLLAVPVSAQLSTGKVEGEVVDKETGRPLAGAQVVIEGTRLGNITNADGYYFILNVPPGRRDITFSFTGYQQVTFTNQLILAGQTATVDAAISSTVIELGGITVEAEADVLIPRDNTVTKHRLTADRIQEMPSTKLEDLLVLEAGVQSGGQGGWGRGVRIRGGRVGENVMVIDGVPVRNYTANPFRSGLGWVWEQELGSLGEDVSPLEFSTGSVEEVDIVTGGFQAEYGNAQSGIINVVTKEGGSSLKGNVRFTTDEQNPRTADYGYNQLQANIGGPVPGIPNLFFHGSSEIQGMADNSPTHADEGFRGIDQRFVDILNNAVRNDQVLGNQMPAYTLEMLQTGRAFFADKMGLDSSLFSPSNPVRQPYNWSDRTLASGKLTYSPVKGLKFVGSSNFSRFQRSYPGDYFDNGRITPSMVSHRNWAADPDTVVVIPQTYGRRTRTSNLLAGFNWDFYQSSLRNATLQFRYTDFRTQDVNSSNLKDDYTRDNTFMSWSAHDIPFEVETFPNREFPRTPEQARIYYPDGVTNWSHEYGYPTPFLYVNNAELYWLTYRYLREEQRNYKADLDFQLDRRNRAKVGYQYTGFDNHKFDINPMTGRNQRDLNNEFNYKPKMYAFYLQNRTDLGDFVFNYGIRYDSFKPENNWGFRYGDQWGETYFPRDINEWSPRFDVAFPVTDKSQMRFAYGVFTQLQSMDFIFSGSNPGNLEYSRTDAFEAGLSYLLSNDMVLDMVAYYRDVTGNLATREFFRDYYMYHTERRVRTWETGYDNKDNGNIKGMDLTLKKRFSDNFAFNLIYTLQFSRTTGSNYFSTSDFWIFMDPTTGEHFRPPDEIRPILGDRTHKLTAYFNYLFPDDFQAGTTANTVLKNVRVNAILTLMSGEPLYDRAQNNYTEYNPLTGVMWLTRRGGNIIGGVNYFRGRWDTNLDLKLGKSFYLGRGMRVSVFSEIFNVLNRKFSTPYPSGHTFEGNRWGPTGGVDLRWDDPSLTDVQRHRFQADFNGDGVLTVMEAAKGNIANSVMNQTMAWQAWGPARQIRLGVDFTF